MGFTLGIDPGLRAVGCGVLDGSGSLFAAWLTVGPERSGRGPYVWLRLARAVKRDWLARSKGNVITEVVVEVPQIYPFGQKKGDDNDLIDLAGVDGAVVGEFDVDDSFHYAPRDWKGQVKKEVMTNRILSRLALSEKLVLGNFATDHNVLDGVGLAKFHHARRKR